MNAIRAQIVKVGNSRGIRIPKVLLDQVGFGSEVEIAVQGEHLVIRPISRPRAGWDEAFRVMAANQDDRLLDEPVTTVWDKTEWTW